MISPIQKKSQGFTIIELLIVIVVIGILVLLVITTYSGIQSKARNTKRASDIKTVQRQIEAYFSNNGHYPSRGDMDSASWLSANMPGLDPSTLADPSSKASNPEQLAASGSTPGAYVYVPEDDTGSSANCEANDTTCTQYTLTVYFEGSYNGASSESVHNLD